MRFKKVPLRTTGMEGAAGFSLSSSMSDDANLASHNSEKVHHSMATPHEGRGGVSACPVPPTRTLVKRDTYISDTRDEETQAAHAKLRQYEALGHIKVEVDEPTEYTVRQSPASGVETTPPSTTQAMVVTSKPISMASFQNTSSLTENVISQTQLQTQYVLVPQQVQLQSSSHTAVVGMLDVPVLHDSEGEYEFSVIIEEKERTTKSPMWLMSRITNKLYTNINKAVPFEIRLKKPIDNDQFCIRAVPVFSSPQFLRTNVTRCPNHAAPTDSTNHDFPYPEHVVRADHPEAHYVKNVSGRLSVVVPLDKLQDGSGYTSILLRFMCLGSCVGGINRRPIAVIITLEDRRGMVYGRKVIDVRVCACPTRDIKTDEQAVLNRGTKRKAPLVQEKVPLVSRKKPRPIEPKAEPQEDDKVFCIPVRGRQLYNFMMEMKAVYYRTHPDYAAKYPDRLMED